ncbi:hypothetical protein Ancab_039312 [Ancistrocladus abbreviatus]
MSLRRCGAEKLYIEKDSIEKGTVELIAKQRIGKLVMGAPAGGKFSRYNSACYFGSFVSAGEVALDRQL